LIAVYSLPSLASPAASSSSSASHCIELSDIEKSSYLLTWYGRPRHEPNRRANSRGNVTRLSHPVAEGRAKSRALSKSDPAVDKVPMLPPIANSRALGGTVVLRVLASNSRQAAGARTACVDPAQPGPGQHHYRWARLRIVSIFSPGQRIVAP
jgi:hypothetical protein